MPRTSNRRWKGCPVCKPNKHAGNGDAERMPRRALLKFPTRRGRRVNRHDVGQWGDE